MTAGILKMLLPAWHVPELNKWIKISDGADREDSDDSDGDGENALPALNASELAVTRKHCTFHYKLPWYHYICQSSDVDGLDE